MVNEDIKVTLKKYNIPYEDGILCLLSIYYQIPFSDLLPSQLILKVLSTGIVSRNVDNSYTWKIPLFDKQEINFAWVADYRMAFKKLNPDRAGSLNTCILRMKKFFSENPHVRAEDVNAAVGMYFRTVKDPQYLITSHKFIYDGIGSSRNSNLEIWLEKYYESQGEGQVRTSDSRKVQ